MTIVGVGLYWLARRYGGSNGDHRFGVWADPPTWARLVFGGRGGLLWEDVLVCLVGLIWLMGGVGLWATSQSPQSSAYLFVEIVLAASAAVGLWTAMVLWFIRSYLRH